MVCRLEPLAFVLINDLAVRTSAGKTSIASNSATAGPFRTKVFSTVGIPSCAIATYEQIRRHIERRTDPEIIVKSHRQWPIGDRPSIVYLPAGIDLLGPIALLACPIHTKVPFADACRPIPVLPARTPARSAGRADQAV